MVTPVVCAIIMMVVHGHLQVEEIHTGAGEGGREMGHQRKYYNKEILSNSYIPSAREVSDLKVKGA